eukprot:scaffold142184_cov142-Phaeocystis_antarctica.AAC.1
MRFDRQLGSGRPGGGGRRQARRQYDRRAKRIDALPAREAVLVEVRFMGVGRLLPAVREEGPAL